MQNKSSKLYKIIFLPLYVKYQAFLPYELSGWRDIVVACVCSSARPSVRKLYLVRAITRHRFELESPNLHQTLGWYWKWIIYENHMLQESNWLSWTEPISTQMKCGDAYICQCKFNAKPLRKPLLIYQVYVFSSFRVRRHHRNNFCFSPQNRLS